MKKLAPLAAFAVAAALAVPAAGWADDGTPPKGSGDRLAKIQERIAKVEDRIATASDKLAELQQKLADKCSTQPAPAAGADQSTGAAPARVCASAQAKLERAQNRLDRAKDRLERIKARLDTWQQKHSGSSVSASDQAALDQLQQQLSGAQS